MMDTGNKGKVTIEELRSGVQQLGQQIPDPDLQILMEAVSINLCLANLSLLLTVGWIIICLTLHHVKS